MEQVIFEVPWISLTMVVNPVQVILGSGQEEIFERSITGLLSFGIGWVGGECHQPGTVWFHWVGEECLSHESGDLALAMILSPASSKSFRSSSYVLVPSFVRLEWLTLLQSPLMILRDWFRFRRVFLWACTDLRRTLENDSAGSWPLISKSIPYPCLAVPSQKVPGTEG